LCQDGDGSTTERDHETKLRDRLEVNLLARAQSLAGGVATLTAWLGSGGETVEISVAQKRTDICLACPLNAPGSALVESVARAIKAQVELRNSMGLRTRGIKSLRTCSACECYLPLKVFVPMNRILPDEAERQKLHPSCWLLNEKP
jgi:hypothetical protein